MADIDAEDVLEEGYGNNPICGICGSTVKKRGEGEGESAEESSSSSYSAFAPPPGGRANLLSMAMNAMVQASGGDSENGSMTGIASSPSIASAAATTASSILDVDETTPVLEQRQDMEQQASRAMGFLGSSFAGQSVNRGDMMSDERFQQLLQDLLEGEVSSAQADFPFK